MAPGFSGGPLASTGGASGLVLGIFRPEGVGEGEDEKDLDLERLPLKELCWEEWLE